LCCFCPQGRAVLLSADILFRLRARTAFLAAASLTAYSEFGLIVAAVVLTGMAGATGASRSACLSWSPRR
jgi:predicted Kef-type K+ transport protein